MNCQSVKNKKAEIHTIIDSAKPDIILGNEYWLTPNIKNSKKFPDSFDAIRKDRVCDAHGGTPEQIICCAPFGIYLGRIN